MLSALPCTECPVLDLPLENTDRQRAELIPEAVAIHARRLLAAVSSSIPAHARPLADAVRARTGDRFQAEAEAFAERLGTDWRDILLANLVYDLTLARIGCSTAALATPSGPVLARNMDWWPEELLARASVVTRWTRDGATAFAAAGWPGALGVVSGLSGRGFALVLNAVNCAEPPLPSGQPVLLFLRTVLEDARDYADALQRIREARLASPGLVTLIGTRNEDRVVIERTPTRAVLRHPDGPAPLITTNAYQAFTAAASPAGTGIAIQRGAGPADVPIPPASMGLPPGDKGPDPARGASTATLSHTACSRFAALTEAVRHACGTREIGDSELLYWLTEPAVMQSITAQHVLLRPAAGTIRLLVPRRLLS